MAAANTWWNLLLARFGLGLAVGAKSSTTPVYAAECAPTAIRGALTMMWQMVRAAPFHPIHGPKVYSVYSGQHSALCSVSSSQ